MLSQFFCLLILSVILTPIVGERLLMITAIGSKSHKIFYMGVVEALAARGHQITVISSYKEPAPIKNIREVIVDFDLDSLLSTAFNNSGNPLRNVILNTPSLCSDTLALKQVQDLKNEKFDLVLISMFMNFCYLSFVHYFKVPFIFMSSAGLMTPFLGMTSNIDFPSVMPQKMLQAKFPLSFMDRFASTVLNVGLNAVLHLYVIPETERICKERDLCHQDISLSEIGHNSSLIIVNSVRTLGPYIPTFPNIIFAGGAHIKRAQSLPKELENWVAESGEEGFIFFSLGSALNPSALPEKYRKILVNVFGSLKQRVLWKWSEENMTDLPKNVKLKKWFPQRDILGHPKLQLFITHGGLSSVQESLFNGVPIIGLPIFVDQFSNVKEAEDEGWGRAVTWEDLEENAFKDLITEIISNKRLRETAKQRSTLMRDRFFEPDQEAAYWVEYVIRHKGAPHMMPPVKYMTWIAIYNIDVWAIITGVILGLFYLIYRLLKLLLGLCLKNSKAKNQKKKKKEE